MQNTKQKFNNLFLKAIFMALFCIAFCFAGVSLNSFASNKNEQV